MIAHEIVSDAVLSATTEAERIDVAINLICYALGAIAAIRDRQQAAEIGYRCADAMVRRP
jgi:hypothetical protein